MKKYQLNTEKKSITPTPKSVEAKKDFGKLFHEYEKYTKPPKKPIYKDPKFFFFLLIVALVAYIIFTEVGEENKEQENTEQIDNLNPQKD